jgi:6,7-dimethyl-8-ribityllumazine synthase
MSTKKNDINIAIVASNFNRYIVDRLYSGAILTLEKNGIYEEEIKVVRVPGAFEIPVAVKLLLNKNVSKQYDAIITLGVIIRGETSHFEYIANECAHGVSQLAIKNEIPIIFGVLTVDNREQAMNRSENAGKNKGSDAAQAALDMVDVLGNR